MGHCQIHYSLALRVFKAFPIIDPAADAAVPVIVVTKKARYFYEDILRLMVCKVGPHETYSGEEMGEWRAGGTGIEIVFDERHCCDRVFVTRKRLMPRCFYA
jgi:hypothetical protein